MMHKITKLYEPKNLISLPMLPCARSLRLTVGRVGSRYENVELVFKKIMMLGYRTEIYRKSILTFILLFVPVLDTKVRH